jgi:putative oxidoreductase
MKAVEKWGPFTARFILGAIFLLFGVQKLMSFSTVAGFMPPAVPFPKLALGAALALEIVGGLALMFGKTSRYAAWALMLFLVPTTILFHAFWNVPAGQMQGEVTNFLKNLAYIAGLLHVATIQKQQSLAKASAGGAQ